MTRLSAEAAWLLERPIAHRGLHNQTAPENSLSAFSRAVEARVPIELDVHTTADGEVVVFHDDNLRRLTGVDTAVREVAWSALAGLRLAGTVEPIPRLREVFDLVGGRVPLLIEVKNRGEVGPTEERLAELLSGYRGPFAVQSFNPFTLDWFRRHHPEIPRGQLAGDFRGEALRWYKKVLLRNLLLNAWSRPHFVGYDVRCLPHAAVTRARQCGVAVLAWTVDTAEKLETARRLADNIIFESIRP
jgi:glycerophosphoryl diester phosphodiesterase